MAASDSRRKIPTEVDYFVRELHKNVRAGQNADLNMMNFLYETLFNRITESTYPDKPWPSSEEVKFCCQGDSKETEITLMLYRELYFKHMVARIPNVSFDSREDSFHNYEKLFSLIFCDNQGGKNDQQPRQPLTLKLPNEWVFGIIDEFVYQFQSFILNRYKIRRNASVSGENQLDVDHDATLIWHLYTVINILQRLTDIADIKKVLVDRAEGKSLSLTPWSASQFYSMFGYFSLYGLIRIHCMLGDYHLALEMVDAMRYHQISVFAFSQVKACHVSTALHVAFAYMMLRRYADAIRVSSEVLLFMQKNHRPGVNPNQSGGNKNQAQELYERESKEKEKILHILAICMALYPAKLDESIAGMLREPSWVEKMARLQKGDIDTFEGCFNYASPKFVNVAKNDAAVTGSGGSTTNVRLHQQRVFLADVRAQSMNLTVMNFLRLYKNVSLTKLCYFLELESVEAARSLLMSLKHRLTGRRWTGQASCLDGNFEAPITDIDFWLEGDIVHVVDRKSESNMIDYFLTQISSIDHKLAFLKATQPQPAVLPQNPNMMVQNMPNIIPIQH